MIKLSTILKKKILTCRLLLLIVTTGYTWILQPRITNAHSIESSLKYINGNLELYSGFSDGIPAEGAVVRIISPNGKQMQKIGKMNSQGKLNLILPKIKEGSLDIQVDAGPGHRDYLLLPFHSGKVQIEKVVKTVDEDLFPTKLASLSHHQINNFFNFSFNLDSTHPQNIKKSNNGNF